MLKENLKRRAAAHTSNKGITLIALIITIVIMLILVVVTLSIALGDNGIVKNAKKATKQYEIAQKMDELAYYAGEYSSKTGFTISDEALTKIAEISIETGIDTSKFMVWHDKNAIRQNKYNQENPGVNPGYEPFPEEYIFYNWSQCTLEDVTKLESWEITNRRIENIYLAYDSALLFDVNGNGYVDVERVEPSEFTQSRLDEYYARLDRYNVVGNEYITEYTMLFMTLMGCLIVSKRNIGYI